MPRLVRLGATGPIKIDPAQWPRDDQGNLKAIWICACGLSPKFPFCDGTHKACKDEEPGVEYSYATGLRMPISATPRCKQASEQSCTKPSSPPQ
ncbi:MAG: CDGSH iron-sulfur domain-containing protein [Phycisphaeraceae bacterium]|nr:CDGSH iron-sulfur domain-containing protein [Phycisphaeraceae bacterium]